MRRAEMVKRRGRRTPAPRRAGQAMIETAIFGSIIIMLLGVMVGYGLNYDYNQSTLMRSFREALGMASGAVNPGMDCDKIMRGEVKDKRAKAACEAGCDCEAYLKNPSANRKCEPICHAWGTGNYAMLEDRHVPDPSHPFGLGSTINSSSSAQVIRDHSQHLGPDTPMDLPRMRMRVAGKGGDDEIHCASANNAAGYGLKGCTTAGYRIIEGVTGFAPEGWVAQKSGRRKPGFGIKDPALKNEILDLKDQKCVNWPGNTRDKEGTGSPKKDLMGQVGLIDKLEEIYRPGNIWLDDDGDGDPKTQQTCMDASGPTLVRVKMLDPCGGELVNQELCLSIAMQLGDHNVCQAQCERARRFITDCTKNGQPWNGLSGPQSNACVCGSKGCKSVSSVAQLPTCQQICAVPMTADQMPWYAKVVNGKYAIEQLFANRPSAISGEAQAVPALGLQPGSKRITSMANSLNRQEDEKTLDTDTRINWTDSTSREFLYHKTAGERENKMGRVEPVTSGTKETIDTKVQRKSDEAWSTPW